MAVIQTLSPSEPGKLWEALKASDKMREAFGLYKEETEEDRIKNESDDKYIKALAESYNNASTSKIVNHC